jgi:hypothetical protein
MTEFGLSRLFTRPSFLKDEHFPPRVPLMKEKRSLGKILPELPEKLVFFAHD